MGGEGKEEGFESSAPLYVELQWGQGPNKMR